MNIDIVDIDIDMYELWLFLSIWGSHVVGVLLSRALRIGVYITYGPSFGNSHLGRKGILIMPRCFKTSE